MGDRQTDLHRRSRAMQSGSARLLAPLFTRDRRQVGKAPRLVTAGQAPRRRFRARLRLYAPSASPCFAIETEWSARPPLFALRPDHALQGEACLRAMGVPEDAWFVCVHVRERGYSPSDQGHHAYRDADIGNYRSAMEEIVRRGGWCVRMGDASMTPLPPMPGLVDYATSSFKSDLMDVILCAQCRFGTSSGLFLVSSAFGVPSALSNMAPLGCSYAHFRKGHFHPEAVSLRRWASDTVHSPHRPTGGRFPLEQPPRSVRHPVSREHARRDPRSDPRNAGPARRQLRRDRREQEAPADIPQSVQRGQLRLVALAREDRRRFPQEAPRPSGR